MSAINNKSVSELKSFLKSKGITISSGLNKENLLTLCQAAQNLQDDPDHQDCNTWKKVSGKLERIGVKQNPLHLKFSSKIDSNSMPPFGLIDIFNYLIISEADFDKWKLNAYKSFNDYRLFEGGHVRDLAIHLHQPYYIFPATVLAHLSQANVHEKNDYVSWFILNEQEVYTAFCECMRG